MVVSADVFYCGNVSVKVKMERMRICLKLGKKIMEPNELVCATFFSSWGFGFLVGDKILP